jgi:hypothetical protein
MIRHVLAACTAMLFATSPLEGQSESAGVELITKARPDSLTAGQPDGVLPATIGSERRIGEGDMMMLPAGVPHQVRVLEGEEVTYILIKVQNTLRRPSAGERQ